MKCSDIPDRPILLFLSGVKQRPDGSRPWSTHNDGAGMPSVFGGFPPNTPDKLILAKMRQMLRRGVVDGCGCGCRGDWVITAKGLAELETKP